MIQSLKLINYRNYAELNFDCDARLNLLYGLNGQGKTNLLEAICYMGIASSFRGAREQELIRFGEKYFFIAAELRQDQDQMRLTAAADSRGRRKWTVNGDALSRLVDIIGLFPVVVFAPDDVNLIKAGPETRRRYLNRQIAQNDREYCRWMLQYNHVVRQRNACLKQFSTHGGVGDEDALAAFTAQLVPLGARICHRRAATVRRLTPLAARFTALLSAGEELSVGYNCNILAEDNSVARSEDLYRAELQRLAAPERLRGLTLCGPHRDDLAVSLNDRTAREFASQGQQRTAALALKLAELELSAQLRGTYPTLLLDDVLSELDSRRREQILSLTLDKTQTFITTTDKLQLSGGARFCIEHGSLVADQS